MSTLLTNERVVVGLLLLGESNVQIDADPGHGGPRWLENIIDLRLRTIARLLVIAQRAKRELTDEALARGMRILGHEPIAGEFEQLRREASLHGDVE